MSLSDNEQDEDEEEEEEEVLTPALPESEIKKKQLEHKNKANK